MDSFDFDNVKAEKARAMRRYNRFRSIAKVFRLVELLLALLFLSWTFVRLPFAVRISGEFFFKLGAAIASPPFVFLLCNVIIATLIAKSGRFSSENICADNVDTELYEEIIKNSENRPKCAAAGVPAGEVVYQDKEIISDANTITRTCGDNDVEMEQHDWASDSDSGSDVETDNPRVYQRSKSEKLSRENAGDVKRELRRSETEKCGKLEHSGEKLYPEDELSNEDFQRAIEEFIAKQLRFRREESLATVVLQGRA